MPLKITPPRHPKAKSLYIRGSYLGVAVDQSARTDRPALARKVLKRIEGEIERGEYGRKATPRREQPTTFLDAALDYLETGHSPRYVQDLVDYFGDTPLSEIDQAAIDECAMELHPNVSNATRNRCVHTPVSAILHRAKIKVTVERPEGAKGKSRTNWYTPEDAFGIIKTAETIDSEFATLLVSLLYTGPRIGAAVDVQREDIQLDEGRQWAKPEKGQDPHAVTLQSDLRDRLAALLVSHDRRRVFRWRYSGHLRWLWMRTKLTYLGIPCPVRQPRRGWREPPNRLKGYAFHTWRHTFLTWMRRYGDLSVDDLLGLGTHKDRRALSGYVHAAPDPKWDKVESLPSMGKMRGARS